MLQIEIKHVVMVLQTERATEAMEGARVTQATRVLALMLYERLFLLKI